tara:strand:+ start:619 stop:993 length:375 start_codon:yes stop_codon:yes gene_type:complete
MKFFHRYEANGGLVLQDQECIIAAGRYILFYYPKTGEFLQIDERIGKYHGAVPITLNEYLGRMGFFRGLWASLKNFIGISYCKRMTFDEPEEEYDTFEDFFDTMDSPDIDLRPPVIVGGGYEER